MVTMVNRQRKEGSTKNKEILHQPPFFSRRHNQTRAPPGHHPSRLPNMPNLISGPRKPGAPLLDIRVKGAVLSLSPAFKGGRVTLVTICKKKNGGQAERYQVSTADAASVVPPRVHLFAPSPLAGGADAATAEAATWSRSCTPDVAAKSVVTGGRPERLVARSDLFHRLNGVEQG